MKFFPPSYWSFRNQCKTAVHIKKKKTRLSFITAGLNVCGVHAEVGDQIRIFYGLALNKAKRNPGSCGRTVGWFGPYIQLAGKIEETTLQLMFRNVGYIPTISDSHCFALVAYKPITSHRLNISNCQRTNLYI